MTLPIQILLCASLLISSGALASEQEQLENLRNRINALKRDFEKTNESKSEAADALRVSELSISDSNRKLNDLAQQQHAASSSLSQLQKQSKQLDKNIRDEHTLLSKLLYQQYLGGKQEYLKLLLNNHDPNQVARELQYYDYIARSRAAWLKTMRDNLNKLHDVTLLTRDKTLEIAALQNEERSQRKSLDDEKRARQQTLAKVAQQLKQQRREMGRLQRDENRLSKLVERLAKMLSRPQEKNTARNETLPSSIFDGKLFQDLKGKLALPVKGDITNKFGSTRPDSTVLWKGLFLRANSSQPVKAVAAGRVVFADWLRGFGNLLIIDHGKGYMSLYGYNESIFKLVGDTVKGGETISSVGNSGGNEESGLYFELRHEGNPLDPIKWVAR
ncbi:MAG: peptidoglycan DD-metalloendopeptidase family protein [Gallionellaceae bacterium]|nr:peptidoglycan DD-metalloendopeptidase family protein [Gallionellaceae bacterium]